MNIDEEYKKMLLKHIDQFEIKEYESKYQNQVMCLGIKTLADEVDEENRYVELKMLAETFSKNLKEEYKKAESKMWILVNGNLMEIITKVKIELHR